MRPLISALLCCALMIPFGPSVAGAGEVTRTPAAEGAAESAQFGWPLDPPPALARPFEAPAHAFGPGHRGVDLAGAAEQPVLAAADGVVVYAGRLADRELVSIEHAGGLRTSYEPVHPLVAVGEQVTRGQQIGLLRPGHCPEACLHWGARRDESYLDPLTLLGAGQVRLLPW